VVRLALLAPLAALLALGARAGFRAYRLERTLVFQPHPPGHLTPAECGLPGAADVEYGRSEGAPLRGWYVPSRNGAAIVFVHGAGGDHTALVREAALLRGAGYGVLLIDLPGEGASGGHITAGRNEEAAVESAIDWLAHHGATRIGALAFSLGSSFLARVAADDARVRAVVLEAASSSNIDRIRATQGDRAWLTTLPATLAWYQEGTSPWRAPPTEAVGAIAPRPLLLITGLRDAWASPGMARELAARAGPTARVELFDSGHGGFWEAEPARYVALLLSFFATALGT
jgi:dienelactone hydrolase